MKRSELEHLLRAAARIVGDNDLVVIGSQAILGTFDDTELPDPAIGSLEADLTFFDDYDNAKSDMVDMHLGEDSHFHNTFGYYAQGVSVEVAELPAGWRERVVVHSATEADGATGHCVEAHDLVVSKLVAGRMKDMEFADALLRAELVNADTLIDRAQHLDKQPSRRRVVSWVVGWVAKHG
jgi:hypothetical protein